MTSQQSASHPLSGTDLIGCRYRLVRDLRDGRPGNIVPTSEPVRDDVYRNHHRESIINSLVEPRIISKGPDADLETLEAMAAAEPFIVNAVLTHERPEGARAFSGIDEKCTIDLLVKIDDVPNTSGPKYVPVLIVAHKLLSPRKGRAPGAQVLPLARATRPGVLGRTMRQGIVTMQSWKVRHHGPDAVRLGQAAALLHRLGVSCGLVGAIGVDGDNIVVVDEGAPLQAYRSALRDARDTINAVVGLPSRWEVGTWPLAPRKVRECKSCRWNTACDEDLRISDDISLLLPGDRATELREKGISTVHELAAFDDAGEQSWLARAVIADIPAIRRVQHTTAPRADVEIDVDMEAYPAHGAYLWGAWPVGEDYKPFVTWAPPGDDGLGGTAEARNFAVFWTWLMQRCQQAKRAGHSVAVYCWAAEGENYWLRQSADRFGGMEFAASAAEIGAVGSEIGADAGCGTVRVPTRAEVDAFISSDVWTDMFRATTAQLLSPHGMSLKSIAPISGFHWRDEDIDGEVSLTLYEQAVGLVDVAPVVAESARQTLLRYNGDDCRSVAHVREWLSSGRATTELPYGPELPGMMEV